MSKKKMILNYAFWFIMDNVIFNILFSIAKTIGINSLGGNSTFGENLLASVQETWIIYTIVFIALVVGNEIYKKNTIQKLNQRLKKIKEGSEGYEK